MFPVVRFVYVDDSGDERRGLLTAVSVPSAEWSACLERWLEFRRQLFHQHGVPAGFELHAGQFVTGRGNPASAADDGSEPPINRSKPLRQRLYREALSTIARLPIAVFTIHHAGTHKMLLYRELLDRVERHLEQVDALGVMVVDGLDEGHRAVHRTLDLADRRILEDPWMQPAHHSQFIQIADLTVHAAFQAIVRNPSRTFMWSWYEQELEPVIVGDLDDATP